MIYMILRKFSFALFFIFCCFSSFAQNSPDSSEIQLRNFDHEKVAAFKENKQFDYDKKSFSISDWFKQFFSSADRDIQIDNQSLWLKIIGWVFVALIFIGIIVFIITVSLDTKLSGFISGKGYKAKLDYDIQDIDIHGIAFETEILNAEKNGNYTAALRFRYLQIIKSLEDKHFIVWKLNKTNYQYWRELEKTGFQDQFKSITKVFEYSWYGQYEIDQKKYSFYREMMANFHSMLEKNTVSLP